MGFKIEGKAADVAKSILSAFTAGTVPAALANRFLAPVDCPSRKWSALNRFIMAVEGTGDARGFRQWEQAGRKVVKGAKALYIFAPLCGKRTDADGNKKSFVYGFKTIPVFRYEDTEGAPVPGHEKRAEFVQTLPLLDVAEKWGLKVKAGDVGTVGAAGSYGLKSGEISLAVENLSTWAHELCHASDDRIQGGLKAGQDMKQEIVAEMAGAVLLTVIGKPEEADLGGCLEYCQHYASANSKHVITVIGGLFDRVCAVVQNILDAAGGTPEEDPGNRAERELAEQELAEMGA